MPQALLAKIGTFSLRLFVEIKFPAEADKVASTLSANPQTDKGCEAM